MSDVNKELAAELLDMAKADQEMRMSVIEKGAAWDNGVDAQNQGRLKEVVKEYGWPSITLVGSEASHAAWLLVQHAPSLEFMEQCLGLMKNLSEEEVSLKNVAYLEDRVLMMNNEPQIYGTQFQGQGKEMRVWRIKDPAKVDELRAKVGLGAFAENEARLRKLYKTDIR